MHSDCGEDTRVLLNSVTCTVSVPAATNWTFIVIVINIDVLVVVLAAMLPDVYTLVSLGILLVWRVFVYFRTSPLLTSFPIQMVCDMKL